MPPEDPSPNPDPNPNPNPALATPDPAPAPTTPLSNDPAPDPAPAPPPDPGEPPKGFFEGMPDDWREQLAGEDPDGKRLKELNRVTDIKGLMDRFFNAQDKIRRGELSEGLPENPTEEQIAEWREAKGIPASADKYEVALEDGLVLGEVDKRMMGGIYEVAHKHNIPSEAMSDLTNAVLKGRQVEEQQIEAQDGIDRQTLERTMRDNWGGDYETNKNMVMGHLSKLSDEAKNLLLNARLGNGMAVFNHPEIMNFFATTARDLDPLGTVLPDGINQVQAMEDEIARLEKKMGEPGWHKDTKSQARYLELVRTKEKLAEREGVQAG